MKISSLNCIYIALWCMLFTSCAEETHKTEAPAKEFGVIELSQKQLDFMDIKVAEVGGQSISNTIVANGVVAAIPNNEAQVSASISGRIEKIFVIQGSRVHKGQPLMVLSSFELIELQNQYMMAKSDREFTEKDFNRQTELRNNNIGALVDFQITEAKHRSALSNEKSLKAKLQLLNVNLSNLADPEHAVIQQEMTITSPIDGFIYKLPSVLGMRTSAETILAEVINNSKLYASVYVYERDVTYVQQGQMVEIEFANKAIPPTVGKVLNISQAVDEDRKTIPVYVEFEAKGSLAALPDMNIKVKIKGNPSPSSSNIIPLSAIVTEGSNHYIYCAEPTKGKTKFRRCRIEIINSDDTKAEIKLFTDSQFIGKIAITNVNMLEMELRNQSAG